MKLSLKLSIAVTKILIKILRITKRGGTTLPGKIAYTLYPNIIKVLTENYKIIMVTGTNGKTTTARIIGQLFDENGIEFITNKSGANLISGITTTFLEACNLRGESSASYALLEIDEAAFRRISKYVEPDILVVTNFFRDQLDRYGELYTTLNGVKTGLSNLRRTKLILNADDSLCASIGKDSDKEAVYYGISNNACLSIEDSNNLDASFCIYCKSKYEYDWHVYGHLGGFKCPTCGYSRPASSVSCTRVIELNSTYTDIQFSIEKIKEFPNSGSEDKEVHDAKVNLPGLYNVYNALSAITCGEMLGLPVENTIKAMQNFECGFGRMETIYVDGKKIKLILVKNPTGFNQVINYLLTEDKKMQVAFLLNDNLADGTDVSWIWDVDFEKLENNQDCLGNVYASGERGEDMAVRLKYAGIYSNKISVIKDYATLISTALERMEEDQSMYILPTYTAMIGIRKILKEKYGLKEFWK